MSNGSIKEKVPHYGIIQECNNILYKLLAPASTIQHLVRNITKMQIQK